MEAVTDSNAKRSASRKRTYLGIAVALVVVVGLAGVAISASGGQDKSQRSGATVTGKKGSAVTMTNITGVEMSVTETRTGTTKILHSCLGPKGLQTSGEPLPKGSSASGATPLAADKAYSHEVGAYPVMRQTGLNGCTVQFERSVGGQIDDLRFEVDWCLGAPYSEGFKCATSYATTYDPLLMTFQSAGIVGPAQRNVVLDGAYIMNGNSTSYSSSSRNPSIYWVEADATRFSFELAYNGQRANNGKYTYSMTFKDVNCLAQKG
ncbi:MAG: hypothetical protein F2723_00155, partial [Actinobacteria bacterium]|nr:hypothetical protein [Actinomycetota bacterium]